MDVIQRSAATIIAKFFLFFIKCELFCKYSHYKPSNSVIVCRGFSRHLCNTSMGTGSWEISAVPPNTWLKCCSLNVTAKLLGWLEAFSAASASIRLTSKKLWHNASGLTFCYKDYWLADIKFGKNLNVKWYRADGLAPLNRKTYNFEGHNASLTG